MKLSNPRLLIPVAAMLACMACPTQASGPRLHYRVTTVKPPDGSASVGNGINDLGWVVGFSMLANDTSQHASLWRNNKLTDLGTLGGVGSNSAVLWPVENIRGIVVGITQTDEPDPLNEVWSCGAFFPEGTGTGKRCVGFKWENGRMTALPTLGGTHGFATGANNWGQIVGWAENKVHDTTCVSPQVLQFRAVLWGPGKNQIRELPPLAGDTTSSATAINDRGQVVGISGICSNAVGGVSAIHNVLWENGKPTRLPDFGGVAWNTPMAINQRGDVVGFANASAADGEAFNPRAFLWSKGHALNNLGMLPGDVRSQGLGINEWRQVVGQSCDNSRPRKCKAFLWQNGVMSDLNALAAPEFAGVMTTANDIDDFGRITGQATDPASGKLVTFVATPYFK